MKVFYRVSPFLSSHPNPLGRNKKDIVFKCFESFKKAVSNQDTTIVADNIPTDWYSLFKGHNVHKAPTGNTATFHRQLDLASKLEDEEKVFLVEDDYLWVPGAVDKIEAALDELSLISPYDHPGHYTEERFKHEPKRIRLIGNQTYREAPSNTLTFATKAKVIKKNLELIKSFGVRDHEMFQSLEVDLFVPVPSLATHLVEGLLAPNVNWNL